MTPKLNWQVCNDEGDVEVQVGSKKLEVTYDICHGTVWGLIESDDEDDLVSIQLNDCCDSNFSVELVKEMLERILKEMDRHEREV